MRIFYIANNRLGWRILEWLILNNENVVGGAVHPFTKRKHGDEIVSLLSATGIPVLDGAKLGSSDVHEHIKSLNPDICISVLFGYILKKDFIDLFSDGCINLHPALLPHNRGAYPNVWSIIDETPAGVSIHYIDEGIDTGDLIAQTPVSVDIVDTGQSLYMKLETALFELFKEQWPKICCGEADRVPQLSSEGTYHAVRDVDAIDEIKLDGVYTGRDIINILRARTFPPYKGAFIRHEGRKIYLKLDLLDEIEFED